MTVPEVDFELETWRMVLFRKGPRADEIPDEMARELRARHFSAARAGRRPGRAAGDRGGLLPTSEEETRRRR